MSLARLGESVFICAPCFRFPRLAMPANMRNHSAPGELGGKETAGSQNRTMAALKPDKMSRKTGKLEKQKRKVERLKPES